jgi:peptide/nickel transport system ATP-binding protein
VKIRPEEFDHLDDEVWERVEVLREILRERERAEKSVTERAKEVLGMETRFSDIDEVRHEVFDGVEMPEAVRRPIEESVDNVRDGDEEAARELMREAFGSVCGAERPDHHRVSDSGRTSFCHRHLDEYEAPGPVFDRLVH